MAFVSLASLGNYLLTCIRPKISKKPKPMLKPPAKNNVWKLLACPTSPMAVVPTAKPTWKKQVDMAIVKPRALAGEKSAARARLAGIATPMPKPKRMASRIS